MISKYILQRILQAITPLFFYMLLFISSSIAVQAQDKKKVLFISSYHPSFPTFFQQIDGVKSILKDVQIDVEFMDSKRFDYDEADDMFLKNLKWKFKYLPKYDAVITADDNALIFLLKYKELFFPNIPAVFLGVNNLDRALQQNNNPSITGVVEAVSMFDTLKLMEKLHPDTDKIIAISDGTSSGMGDLNRYKKLSEKFPNKKLEYISLEDYKFNSFWEKLAKLDKNTPVLLLSAYLDKEGSRMNFNSSLLKIKQHLKAPLYHLWSHGMGDGILGGKLINHYYQGRSAGKIVLDILNGKNISEISVKMDSPNRYFFDYFQLEQFNIQLSQLPKESIIENRPISFFEENKTLIWPLILFIFLLIIIVLIIQINIIKRRRIEQQLKTLVSNLPGMAYRTKNDKDRSVLFLSDNCKELTGYEVDDFIQNKLITYNQVIHEDDREHVWDTIQKALMIRQSFEMEYRIIMADGFEKWVWEHGIGIFKNDKLVYIEGIILDNNKRKKAEKELETANDKLVQKKNELETIIKEAPNPIILHQDGGKILMLNQAWINSSGYSLEETPTIDAWVEHIHDDIETKISLKKHIYSLYEITEKSDEGEFTFLNKNRDLVTWQFSSAPLGVIDGKRTVISSAMDITELKHKDEMLINQSRHAAMGEMIGMIAHQWRQPISSIAMDANNMLLDIALEDFNTTEAGKYANSITQQTQHLSQTIDDFRNFFKPDKVISEVNIRETIDSTLSIVKDSLKNNNIELTTSFETDKKVKAYPRELMQVFVNIINNSKDALRLNKPVNAIISIRVYEDEKYINTQVCDNGGGIDVDILPKVFDPYFSTKDEKTGTGIGLYMSKMIIENHLDGTIEVYNNDDGACFRVRLLKEQMGKG